MSHTDYSDSWNFNEGTSANDDKAVKVQAIWRWWKYQRYDDYDGTNVYNEDEATIVIMMIKAPASDTSIIMTTKAQQQRHDDVDTTTKAPVFWQRD